jgi:aryl-alcohol dehydrogenase
MTRSIKAAVVPPGGRPLAIRTLEIEDPGPDEVLVRIVASGICHTDIGCCAGHGGHIGAPGGSVLGHEGAGIVAEVGREVTGVSPGDHVVLSYASCGRCPACAKGRPADCDDFWRLNFGFERLDGTSGYRSSGVDGHFFGQSSFATFSLATERNLVKVDPDLPLELLAPLGCGFQTGAGTVLNSLGVKPGHSLAVFGVGAVGLAAVMAGSFAGADPIVAVDIRPRRLALARDLGATHAIDSGRAEIRERIARITGHGVDRAVDTTGDARLTSAVEAWLNPGGRLALLNGEPGGELSEDRRVLRVIQGDAVPQKFIPRLISLWRGRNFPFDELVRFYDFTEINRAIEDAEKGRTVKPVLRMEAPG